jgi:hypothetical protein
LPPERRLVCWAHLDRDFRKCADRGGEAEAIGRAGSEASEKRIVRGGALWRKNVFGSPSEGGCRFAERMLTVVQTLWVQHRSVLEYLERAIAAHRHGEPAPKLLGQSRHWTVTSQLLGLRT